jgi:hypothetical protein
VEAGSVPGRSNLRIRCPKGRGSSTLPSRTTSDLRIFVPGDSDHVAEQAVLLTLAHGTSRSRSVSVPHAKVSRPLRSYRL